MTQIANPLTGKSYSVAGSAPVADSESNDKINQHRPLITYSSVFGGLFVIAFVLVNDFGVGRYSPVATDSKRMVIAESGEASPRPNARIERHSKQSRKSASVAKRRRGRADPSPQVATKSKNPENLSIGIFEGTFCRGAKRSTFCD